MTLRRWSWLLAALGVLLALPPSAAGQGTPSFAVHPAVEAGWRPVVEARGLLQDRSLRGALESGFPLRFRLRIELWSKGLFDRLVADEEIHFALLQDPLDRTFLLDTGRGERRYLSVDDAGVAVATALRPTLAPQRAGRYYYLATLEVESLSLSDLEELRHWLRGEVRPAVRGDAPAGRAVERGLRRLMVRVIGLPTRRFESRSGTFAVR